MVMALTLENLISDLLVQESGTRSIKNYRT